MFNSFQLVFFLFLLCLTDPVPSRVSFFAAAIVNAASLPLFISRMSLKLELLLLFAAAVVILRFQLRELKMRLQGHRITFITIDIAFCTVLRRRRNHRARRSSVFSLHGPPLSSSLSCSGAATNTPRHARRRFSQEGLERTLFSLSF